MTRLSIAIPSKGRLKDKTETWLQSAGFKLRQLGGGRGYSAELDGLPECDVMLLSASEIAKGLISGDLHVGVTGEDLIEEYSPDNYAMTVVLERLGFGGADIVVAVPAAWLDVDTIADLEAAGALFRQRHGRRLRVATKYLRSTRRFFAQMSMGEYRLVESAGATEAAPAAGTADLIVDITSTGSTLKANDLKVLSDGVILKSQAALVGSMEATWAQTSLLSLKQLLVGSDAAAQGKLTVRFETEQPIPDSLAKSLDLTLLANGAAHGDASKSGEIARKLASADLGCVDITTVNHVYKSDNAVFEAFVSKLSQTA